MNIKIDSLNSRIARRVFLSFIACALIPVAILAALSLAQVSSQLADQGRDRLRRAARGYGLSIYEHLIFCDDALKLVALRIDGQKAMADQRFTAIGRQFPDGRYESAVGPPIPAIRPTPQETAHLETGKSLLVTDGSRIVIVRHFDAGGGDGPPGLLMAQIREGYLWGIDGGNVLPPLCEAAVFSEAQQPLYHSAPVARVQMDTVSSSADQEARVDISGDTWFLAHRPIFLKPRFGVANWHIVVLQSEADVLAPVSRFTTIFILVLLLALLLVVTLSLFSLRRSLRPIEALNAGAHRIARNDFSHRVQIDSRDEFQTLAQSFNEMSSQLGRQFQFLSTQDKINQATLTVGDFSHIAGLAVTCILQDFEFRTVAISRVNENDPDDAVTFVGHHSAPDSIARLPFIVAVDHLDRFRPERQWITDADPASVRHYLPDAHRPEAGPLTLFPVFVKGRLYALLTVVEKRIPAVSDEGQRIHSLIRQIADHLAVAWSNVNLIQELRRLTTGSMQALARAVDAKSPWTAGHSSRVMRIAMSIGRQMGMDKERLEKLQQAALLHDIGKIGVSKSILDKPGKLTDEEFATIRMHPVIGDTILNPIEAFREVIPMIRQHHERWDGKGYPEGLAGDAIIFEARILAVADVYDAMTSDRPYRKGMDLSRAISIIRSEAGHQFDPAVVVTFLALMESHSALAA